MDQAFEKNKFLKEVIWMVNKYMKKIFHSANYQGNASQNHSELSPHSCQEG